MRAEALGGAIGVAVGAVLPMAGLGDVPVTQRSLTVANECTAPIWLVLQPNRGGSSLAAEPVRLAPATKQAFGIADRGWAGRLWAKTGCDAAGRNCQAGEAVEPCPANGCQPPADTKVEIFFPDNSGPDRAFYDVSLVDGYSLPVAVVPNGAATGRCQPIRCEPSLADCPAEEIAGLGDLRVRSGDITVQCLSPSKRWNWPTPLGLGRPEQEPLGLAVCCPTPPVSARDCREGVISRTHFLHTVRRGCPGAYAFAYDDDVGLHNCQAHTSFTVRFCPAR